MSNINDVNAVYIYNIHVINNINDVYVYNVDDVYNVYIYDVNVVNTVTNGCSRCLHYKQCKQTP